MSTVIKIENLYKEYNLGVIGHDTLYRDLQSWWAKVRRVPDPNSLLVVQNYRENKNLEKEKFLALKNINLEVKSGEVLGIIGSNGAGKSTLLKILSRVTGPTSGSLKIRGRIASLLEVGTGFHSELTGRENIYLNGAINGMNKKEVSRKIEEIIDFSGVEKFIDTPVKRYSSGMHVRLGFAVAAHLDQEILVVDEVLAVGDSSFQEKAIKKMDEVSKGEGRTVLFVSHNMSTINKLCQRAIILDQGSIINEGETAEIVSNYLKKTFLKGRTHQIWDDKETAAGGKIVSLKKASVRPVNGSPDDTFYITTPIIFEFEYWNHVPDIYLNFTLALYNQDGVFVLSSFPLNEELLDGKRFPEGLYRSTCFLPGKFLNDGTYYARIQIILDRINVILQEENILTFEVLDSSEMRIKGGWNGKFTCAIRPYLKWETEIITD